MTAATTLSQQTLAAIQAEFDMTEVTAAEGGPFIPLTSPMGPVGSLRLFRGTAVPKMVYIGMTVPPIGLDSHMIFAFTAPDSAVPHFTLDSVMNAPDFAFHLDLIPRVDLGANLEYLTQVFGPLDATFKTVAEIEGLHPARLGPTQYALMSPWMLVYRADAKAFDAIQAPVQAYLEHWFGLVHNGVAAPEGYSAAELSARDQHNRAAIFNPQVDKVWAQVDRLLGPETSARLREILKNQAVETA